MKPINSKDLLLLFAKRWEAKYGKPYMISWGKDGAQMKRLLVAYGPDELTKLIDAFFSTYSTDFVMKAGRSIGVFVSQVPALIAHVQENEKLKTNTSSTSSDLQRLQAARAKIMGGGA